MSDPLSEITAEELTARVLAWQHRHPLARRLRAADVQSIGHVAVPFVDPAAPPPEPAGGSLRERALARANASAAPMSPPTARSWPRLSRTSQNASISCR